MSMATEDFLQNHIGAEPKDLGGTGFKFKDRAPAVFCADGVHLSVQASETHYCSPREDFGPYSSVEVGFPSITPPESWMEYCEDVANPTQTVYGYIPISLVAEFIDAHGGVDLQAMKARAAAAKPSK